MRETGHISREMLYCQNRRGVMPGLITEEGFISE